MFDENNTGIATEYLGGTFAFLVSLLLFLIVVVIVELLELLLVSSSQLLVEWSLMNLTKMTKTTY
jgi:hypothetical protein